MKQQNELMRIRKSFEDPPHAWSDKVMMGGILDLLENLGEVLEYEKDNNKMLRDLRKKIDYLTRLQGLGHG